jgi:type II secretory pathway pseudopilin PulG
MAAFFLLLAVLVGVVLVDAVLENTSASSIVLFNRSFDQLSGGELLVVFAALGFLLTLFLFLAFGSSRTRRSRRKELRSRRRDAEGRVEELERENARLRQEATSARENVEALERQRTDATTERDRAEAAADRLRAGAAQGRTGATAVDGRRADTTTERNQAAATGVDRPPPADGRTGGNDRGPAVPPEPVRVRHERIDDRTESMTPVRDEHVRAADEHAQAADEHARAADEEARRR